MDAPHTGRAALVTTLRDAGDSIDSFVAWHLDIGFERLFLFFDDPDDPDLPRLAAHPRITAIAHDEALRHAWMRLPEYNALGSFTGSEVIARQVLNVGIAMNLARQQGLDWLLHIDADELFFSPNQPVAELFAAGQAFDTIPFPNFEAVPEASVIGDPFREVDLFKVPAIFSPGPFTPEGQALLRSTPQLQPGLRFHFYTNGKSAVRLGARDVRPNGVHSFARTSGETRLAPVPAAYVLHYACCGFEAFWTKYRRLGRFSDRWFGQDDIRALIGPLHLDARDVVAGGDRDAALDFYRRRIAIEDPARGEALIAHGILLRIPEPRQLLARLDAVR
ncbi:MAG: hypothetical protein JWP16_1716 [Alphaproteobacteria bacterium]|nr:hypothetical protein [Alphaproteobacteria bacterium]